jgi:signal transduction histidine kinase
VGPKRAPVHPSREKKKNIIRIQWVVVIGTSYFLLFKNGLVVEDPWALSLVSVLLASVLVFQSLPQDVFDHKFFPHALVVVDTILISLGISLNKESPWDLFVIFFFGLFIAGIGQSLLQIVVAGLIISILPVVMGPLKGMSFEIDSDMLLRIPFLFGVFILYGYLAEQAKSEKRRSEQRLAALHEVNLAISSTLDLRLVLDTLLEKTDLFLPYSAAITVRLLNRDTKGLIPVASRNLDEEEWMLDRGAGNPANLVLENKAPVKIGNVQTDAGMPDSQFFRKHGLISYLGIPLIAKDEVVGVLSFYTREEHEFGSEEVDFLTTLAGQAAIAIYNSDLYEQTKKQAVELQRSNKVKDEFLSVMSHELKTPLNVVLGYTVMIRDGMLGEVNSKQEESLGKVISRCNDLLTMISDMLDATRIEAGVVKVESDKVNLFEFLGELRSVYDIPLDNGVTVKWDYPPGLPVVKTDRQKLKQILQNLINNAIKFTEKGHVTISARYSPKTTILEFKVSDTGIGIPKEILPTIFDRFFQVDSSNTRIFGGVGLGLYIVKKYTEMLEGKVEVESQPDEGSIFTVRLPTAM